MPNKITFGVPKTPSTVINPNLEPLKFIAQFKAQPASGDATLPDPHTLMGAIELLCAAFDSGYGANTDPMPVMPLWEHLRLKRHGLAQANVARRLLRYTPNVGWCKSPFVQLLDDTDETFNGYQLGMLYARVSTERWGKEKKWGGIKRFWHYKVLKSTAVNFGFIEFAGIENPDFLVQFTNGTWAVVEAKGSLNLPKVSTLRDGMQQAMKLLYLEWQSPGKPLEIACPKEHAVSMAYFNHTTGYSLEVIHLDPPSHRRSKPFRQGGRPVWFKEAVDLLEWSRSIGQFKALQNLDIQWPRELPSDGLVWARWQGAHDQACETVAIYQGVPVHS